MQTREEWCCRCQRRCPTVRASGVDGPVCTNCDGEIEETAYPHHGSRTGAADQQELTQCLRACMRAPDRMSSFDRLRVAAESLRVSDKVVHDACELLRLRQPQGGGSSSSRALEKIKPSPEVHAAALYRAICDEQGFGRPAGDVAGLFAVSVSAMMKSMSELNASPFVDRLRACNIVSVAASQRRFATLSKAQKNLIHWRAISEAEADAASGIDSGKRLATRTKDVAERILAIIDRASIIESKALLKAGTKGALSASDRSLVHKSAILVAEAEADATNKGKGKGKVDVVDDVLWRAGLSKVAPSEQEQEQEQPSSEESTMTSTGRKRATPEPYSAALI